MGSTLAEAVCSKNQNVIKILKLKPFAILLSIDIVVSVKSLLTEKMMPEKPDGFGICQELRSI
jgi:hypothetical protein